MKHKAAQPASPKRAYRKPSLKIHGDFRKVTASKGGINNDGGGKPRTRNNQPATVVDARALSPVRAHPRVRFPACLSPRSDASHA